MQLTEALSNPYPYTWDSKTEKSWKGSFKTKDDHLVSFGAYGDLARGRWDVVFERNRRESTTGEGDQFRIFATVIKMIEEFVKAMEPKEFYFTGEKPAHDGEENESRVKLYGRLAQQLARSTGYKLEEKEYNGGVVFNFHRRVDESFRLLKDLLTEF